MSSRVESTVEIEIIVLKAKIEQLTDKKIFPSRKQIAVLNPL